MKKIIISILIVTVVSFFNMESNSMAEEVVLCTSHADQYIVMVNDKGDCIESEIQIVLSGSGMEAKKSMAPVANFMEDEKCDGEGAKTEIGFDENGNGELDKNEITSTTGTCSPIVEESSEVANSSEE